MAFTYKMTEDLHGNFDGTPYMDSGIHANCELTKVEYGKSEKGNEFLAFYFEDPSGAQVSKTEWPVRMPEVLTKLSPEEYAKDNSSEKNMYESMITNQMARIKHICVDSGIVDNDKFTFEAETFKDFAESVVNIIGKNNEGKKVRIKVVYDRNNFTSLPSYTRYVWIESMDVSDEESKIRILSIDKMQRTQSDREVDSPNPFDNSTNSSESKDDLPF